MIWQRLAAMDDTQPIFKEIYVQGSSKMCLCLSQPWSLPGALTQNPWKRRRKKLVCSCHTLCLPAWAPCPISASNFQLNIWKPFGPHLKKVETLPSRTTPWLSRIGKINHTHLCPWGWCPVLTGQQPNGVVLGCFDGILPAHCKANISFAAGQKMPHQTKHGLTSSKRSLGPLPPLQKGTTPHMTLLAHLWKRDLLSLRWEADHWEMGTKQLSGLYKVMQSGKPIHLACLTGAAPTHVLSVIAPLTLATRGNISRT